MQEMIIRRYKIYSLQILYWSITYEIRVYNVYALAIYFDKSTSTKNPKKKWDLISNFLWVNMFMVPENELPT